MLVELTIPTMAGAKPFAKHVGELPVALQEVGRHRITGMSSPMPMDGGHVRVSAHLVDATDEGLERFSRDLEQHLGRLDHALTALPEDVREDFPALLLSFVDAYAEAIGPAAGRHRES